MSRTESLSARLDAALAEIRMTVAADLQASPGDPVPEGTRTILLLSPREPDFWPYATEQPEFSDGASDPLDRLSQRLIASVADALGMRALFPFGGPPYAPFINWAERSNRIWASPIGFLVSREVGLFVSFRGALAVADEVSLPPPTTSPCLDCTSKPCLAACPVDAFASGTYDVALCRDHVAQPDGSECRLGGCLARRACPYSAHASRSAEQSAFHMKAFLQ